MKTARVSRSSGFTIIETLIVLVISVSLFVVAATLINGKQNAAAFNQGVRSVQTQMQKILNEVGSGYYMNDGTADCQRNGSNVQFISTDPVIDDPQGRSEDCLYLGIVVQLGVPGQAAGTEQLNAYTLVGLTNPDGDEKIDLVTSGARVLAPQDPGEVGVVPDQKYETRGLRYGMKVSQKYMTAVGQPESVAAVGFITNMSAKDLSDGSQRTDIVPLSNVALGLDAMAGAQQINADIKNPTPVINPSTGVKICFNSDTTSESALMQIGGAGRQETIEVKRFTGLDCGK